MPEPEPYEPPALTGNAPADVAGRDRPPRRASGDSASCTRSPTSRLATISARLSAQVMAIVARSARVADGHEDPVPDERRGAGQDRGREVPAPLARRGRPGPREGDRHLLDLHRRARAERLHLHRAHRGLHGSRRRSRPVGGDRHALRPAARRSAGARHPDDRRGRGDGRPRALGERPARPRRADHGLRPSHLPGRGSRARACSARTAEELGSPRVETAKALEDAALAELQRRHPERELADQRRVLGRDRPRRRRDPGEAHAGDVRVRSRRGLVGAHPRAEARRPAHPARPRATSGRAPRSLSSL